jgi:hypothetical protein
VYFWIPSIRRIIVTMASYVVAMALRDVPEADAVAVYGVAGIVVFSALVVDEYYASVRPAKRIEELAPIALDGVAEPLLAQLKANAVMARINLMIPRRTWRWLGLVRYFKMRWSKGMTNQPDVNLSFRLNQGITGACFQTGKPMYADRDQILNSSFALPDKLRRHAPDLQAIFSYPVYEPARKGKPQSGKLLGVLNLDSTSINAYTILMVTPVFDEVHANMQNIAMLAARFYE